MKKIITLFILCVSLGLMLMGCQSTITPSNDLLETPKNIRVEHINNEQYLLFDTVEHANRYTATFYQNDKIIKQTPVSNNQLLDLPIGEYDVDIYAQDTTYAYEQSKKSDKITFIKETNVKYFNFDLNSTGTSYIISQNKDQLLPQDIILPTQYNSIPVETIKEDGFEHANLNSVVVLENIKLIDKNAFSNSTITKIELPDTLSVIEDGAFYSCLYLKEIKIPSALDTISFECFYKCASLTEIIIPASVTTIEPSAFSGCNGLGEKISSTSIIELLSKESIKISLAELAEKSLTELNEFLSTNNATSILSFNKIYASTNPEEIRYDVTLSNGLNNLTILNPDTLIEVGNNAFAETPWFTSHPIGLVYVGKILYACNGQLEGVIDNIREDTIGVTRQVFFYQRGITKVIIPGSIKGISHTMFRNCGLSEIIIEEGVEYIDIQAFDGCGNLQNITLPSTLKTINEQAFINCSRLSNITFTGENNLEYIGANAFSGCSNLTTFEIPSSVNFVGSQAFSNCHKLTIYLQQEAPATWSESWNSTNVPVIIEKKE